MTIAAALATRLEARRAAYDAAQGRYEQAQIDAKHARWAIQSEIPGNREYAQHEAERLNRAEAAARRAMTEARALWQAALPINR